MSYTRDDWKAARERFGWGTLGSWDGYWPDSCQQKPAPPISPRRAE